MRSLEALPGVAAVRGLGLLVAAELVEQGTARAIAARCLEAGLVVNAVTPSALRLAPSLLVSNEEIDEAVAIVDKAIAA
jgi:acetylornithine/succinyldiaminopimelate/putrescine aminotransferase